MLTVLVIDDNESVRTLFGLMLRQWGHAVLTAETGEIGLAQSRQTVVDVACIDVGLPGKDGFAICRELQADARQAGRDLPVLMFTGAFSRDAEKRALAAGAIGLWKKPFPWPELRAQLRRVSNPPFPIPPTAADLPAR